jgi:uncharacterized membrane protein YccC
MRLAELVPDLSRLAAEEQLHPAATRALRATVAFMVPLVLAAFGLVTPTQAVVASFAGHAIAGLDIRGAYAVRLTFFLGLTAVLTGAAWLGVQSSAGIVLAVLGTGLVALGAGVWRHILGEYGFSVSASSALIFFIALSATSPGAPMEAAVLPTLLGSLGGAALHAAFWPFLAQHPLRRAVAASWTAVGDLCEALPPTDALGASRRHERVVDAEHALRTILNQGFEALAGARTRRTRPVIGTLETLNHAAAQLASNVLALEPILAVLDEGAGASAGRGALTAAVRSMLTSLVNTTRSCALAVISHQPSHLGRFEVRVRRLAHLLRVLQERCAQQLGDTPEGSHCQEVLRKLQEQLPALRGALRATVERAQERGPISYELFDLETWALRPVASVLNLSLRFDPALVRFALRVSVMMMAGAALWRGFNLPHGYWIPLCVLVVIQPDYGATRARATQRTLGTLAGSFTASLILWLHPPFWLLMGATALVCWAFTYELKRDYAAAVFFITLLMVIQMEASGPVTMILTVQRLTFTLAGCLMALVAALAFWPVWERDRMPPLLAEALRANAAFLTLICRSLAAAEPGRRWPLVEAKRRAEQTNSALFSSLNRMAGDPRIQQEGIEHAAALANGNLRITRWLSATLVHLHPEAPALDGLGPFALAAPQALEALAQAAEGAAPEALTAARAQVEAAALPTPGEPRAAWVATQLELAATELSGMLLEA